MAGLNRRQFLTAGALGTFGAALEGRAQLLGRTEKPWNARVSRELRKFRDPIPTACTACPIGCSVLAFREGARVVQLGPNPIAPPFSVLCGRAYEALEALYDPERVLKPLRRKGRRGEGKWEEISWGEALAQIADVLKREPESAWVDAGRPDPLAGTILQELGVRNLVGETASLEWSGRRAQEAVYGAALARPDLTRARTILLLGTRPLDGGNDFGPRARDLIAAQRRGAAIVAIGPYGGVTGSLAAEWIPCRPGTEALVALGLAWIVLSEGWVGAAGFERITGLPPKSLLEALSPYTPEQVGLSAGIPVHSLVRLARRLAAEGPSLCLVDGSGTRHAEALEAAAAVLNCLPGNPEAAGIRLAYPPQFVPAFEATVPRTKAIQGILGGTGRASLYLAYRSNPVYGTAHSDAVRQAFARQDRVGLLVAMDSQLTETAELADLVLPAATDLELWNLSGGFTPEGKPYAILQQPTPPRPTETRLLRQPGVPLAKLFDGPGTGALGEARQLGDALLEVLAVLRHPAREQLPFADCGAYVRKVADALPVPLGRGGFEALRREGVWVGQIATYPWATVKGFPTPSGKLQVGPARLQGVPAETPSAEGDSFALVILSYPELGPGYANTRWGREIRFRHPVYMNASIARKMGLREGDRVRIRTDAAEAEAQVVPIEGIHPRAVAMAQGFGHWAGGVAATAQARPTGDEPQTLLVKRTNPLNSPLEDLVVQHTMPGEVPWWSEYGAGVSVWRLTPLTSDEFGALAWREISVTIRPA